MCVYTTAPLSLLCWIIHGRFQHPPSCTGGKKKDKERAEELCSLYSYRLISRMCAMHLYTEGPCVRACALLTRETRIGRDAPSQSRQQRNNGCAWLKRTDEREKVIGASILFFNLLPTSSSSSLNIKIQKWSLVSCVSLNPWRLFRPFGGKEKRNKRWTLHFSCRRIAEKSSD